MSSGAHDHPEFATVVDLAAERARTLTADQAHDAALAALTARVSALEGNVPPPPPPPPPSGMAPFRFGVSFVQNTTDGAFGWIKGTGLEAGIHGVGFGGNAEGTDLASRLAKIPTGTPIIVHGAFSPQSMSTNTGKAPWSSPYARVRPDKAAAMGTLFGSQCKSRADVVGVSYSNEHKGYGSGDKVQFCTDYVAFMQAFEAAIGRTVDKYGPYSNGGDSSAERQAWHQSFLANVVGPRPTLAQGFAYDCGDGSSSDIDAAAYIAAGSPLLGFNFEHYPGGGNGVVPTVTQFVDQCLFMALSEHKVYSSLWGVGGASGSDSYEGVSVVNSDSKTSSKFGLAYIALAAFAKSRPIVKVASGKYTNAAGKTLTVGGDTVTVA